MKRRLAHNMSLQLRNTYCFTDRNFIEGGCEAHRPFTFFAAAAVLTNLGRGRGFAENLNSEILEMAPKLGAADLHDH